MLPNEPYEGPLQHAQSDESGLWRLGVTVALVLAMLVAVVSYQIGRQDGSVAEHNRLCHTEAIARMSICLQERRGK
jgi:hypothetical protein